MKVFTNPEPEWPIKARQAYLISPNNNSKIRLVDKAFSIFAHQNRQLSPKEHRAQIDLTRERGARRRILEKWDEIEREYGRRIDGHRVLRVLNRDLDEKKPTLKTVQNHLSQLRKDGLIP